MFAACALLVLSAPASEWSVVADDDAVRVACDGAPVIAYRVAMTEPPPEIDRPVAGNGFVHPVHTPGGAVVTDDFPDDHPHQHGLFHAWTRTQFRGHRVDFWNTHKGLGRVEHEAIRELAATSRGVRIVVTLTHRDRTTTPPVVAMREQRTLGVHRVAEANVIDWTTRLWCGTDDPITFEKYLYGGTACRGAAGWSIAAGHRFVTPGGDDRLQQNHQPTRWVASTGPVDGEPRTIVMLSHRENLRSPQPARLHPEMPYFVFSPTVNQPYTLRPDETLVLRYRYLIHDGEPDAAQIAEWLADYDAEPSAATVSRSGGRLEKSAR